MILALKKLTPPDGISIQVLPATSQRDISEAWAIAIFSVAAAVPTGLLVAWLSKVLIDKKSTVITINRKELHFDEGKLTSLIEETKHIKR